MLQTGHNDQEAAADKASPRRWPRTLARVAVSLLGIYVAIMIAMLFIENRLLFFPSRYPVGEWHPKGIAVEDANFQAADGTRLHGWYVAHANPRAVILFCHGNAGNVTGRVERLQLLHRVVGASVLVFDYRGFGRSEGSPNEAGILADARAARAWLAKRAGVAEKDIVVMGESIGGAVAVDLAAKDGARALVLDSTFDALPNVAAYHYPWLPVRWLMHTQLNSAAKIGQYHGPLLQVHGDADTIVPIQFGQRLFAAANELKKFILLPGNGHNDGMSLACYETLARLLDSLPHTVK